MASYFVAAQALPDGAHAVHDRSRCPPACFPFEHGHEYLGEFGDPAQALAVARLRYPRVCSCRTAAIELAPAAAAQRAPSPART